MNSKEGGEGCENGDLWVAVGGEDLLKLETRKRVVVGLWELEIKVRERVELPAMARSRYDYVAEEGWRTRVLAGRSRN